MGKNELSPEEEKLRAKSIKLCEEYQKTIFRHAYLLTTNLIDAQEVTADTQVALFKEVRTKGYFPTNLRSWLLRVAYNKSMDVFRKRGRLLSLICDDPVLNDAVDEDSPTPLQIMITKELKETVNEVVKSLPDKYRVPLVRFYYEGLSHHEIGEGLGIPKETSRTRVDRAREMIRVKLVLAGFDPSSS